MRVRNTGMAPYRRRGAPTSRSISTSKPSGWNRSPTKTIARPTRLLADDLNHDLASPRARVEFEQHDLLPRAERQRTVGKGHCDRRSQQGGAHVARPVVVAPAKVVSVFTVPRRNGFEYTIQIGNRAR